MRGEKLVGARGGREAWVVGSDDDDEDWISRSMRTWASARSRGDGSASM